MKRLLLILILCLVPLAGYSQQSVQGTPNGYPVSVSFGTGGSAGTPIVQSSPNVNYPTPFGIAITTIIATSSTAATASTVLIGTLYCVNTSASAATMLVTNTAGTSLVGGAAGFSIPANSDVTRNFFSGLLAVGIKWWSGTTNVLNCAVTGWQ